MLDQWCYEIINLESGYLRIEATAAQMILNELTLLHVQIPNGIAIAASTLVGGAIGEGNISKAKSYAKIILIASLGIFMTIQVLIFTFRIQIAELFTQDASVQYYILKTLSWAMLCMFFDALVTIQIGIIKGLGKQP